MFLKFILISLSTSLLFSGVTQTERDYSLNQGLVNIPLAERGRDALRTAASAGDLTSQAELGAFLLFFPYF